MSQQSSTMNLLIHDANGQPQVIKVLQATSGKQAMQTSLKNVYRTQGQDGGQGSVLASGQVLRQIGLQGGKRLVTLPIQQVIGNKGQHVLQKTIRFTPQQMANLKMLSGSPRKIMTMQTSAGSQNVQVLSSNRSASPTNVNSKIISPILDHTGARKRQEHENDYTPEYTKRRKTEKVGKGLRHFSMKVCEKVRRKGTTSYNEVADELVSEFTSGIHGSSPDNQQYDQKNIRRRVYDALNVLMAMNIISKEKKEIRWLGLPTNSVQECRTLEKDKVRRMERIKIKTQQLHDLILQQVSFKSLVERNRLSEQRGNIPNSTSTIELPFIIIKTNKKTKIECSISNDKSEYLFHFENKFQIHDDIEILKRMGLDLGLDKGECTNENLIKAKSLVPRALETYIEELGRGANPENIMPTYEEEEPEHSRSSLVHAEDLVETTMDEDLSISDHPSDEEEYEEDAMSDGDNQ